VFTVLAIKNFVWIATRINASASARGDFAEVAMGNQEMKL
jgi:hypothetical protein